MEIFNDFKLELKGALGDYIMHYYHIDINIGKAQSLNKGRAMHSSYENSFPKSFIPGFRPSLEHA